MAYPELGFGCPRKMHCAGPRPRRTQLSQGGPFREHRILRFRQGSQLIGRRLLVVCGAMNQSITQGRNADLIGVEAGVNLIPLEICGDTRVGSQNNYLTTLDSAHAARTEGGELIITTVGTIVSGEVEKAG